MPSVNFEITQYGIRLTHGFSEVVAGVQIVERGAVAAFGNGYRFTAYFLSPGSPVPPSFYDPSTQQGGIFLPFEDMPPYVDLVRNEKPLFCFMDSDHPENNAVLTFLEPVGEAE